MATTIPPIKCQGIKTKLVPRILETVHRNADGLWIEPFLGSGVVTLNVLPKRALLADSNPHLIQFYKAIQDGAIDGPKTRTYLELEGKQLEDKGGDYYYHVRERFNATGDPLDFLFLNRSCFNGVMRFNKKGGFNVPWGHKPKRFRPAYVTKIVNQVARFKTAIDSGSWRFVCQDYQTTIQEAGQNDFVYCDPPYIGRHADYYNSWNEENELLLHRELKNSEARFMISTWHNNEYRKNEFVEILWNEFDVHTYEHFYHVGAREKNRNPMVEALVVNYTLHNGNGQLDTP